MDVTQKNVRYKDELDQSFQNRIHEIDLSNQEQNNALKHQWEKVAD